MSVAVPAREAVCMGSCLMVRQRCGVSDGSEPSSQPHPESTPMPTACDGSFVCSETGLALASARERPSRLAVVSPLTSRALDALLSIICRYRDRTGLQARPAEIAPRRSGADTHMDPNLYITPRASQASHATKLGRKQRAQSIVQSFCFWARLRVPSYQLFWWTHERFAACRQCCRRGVIQLR
jgi:hypothetical protein